MLSELIKMCSCKWRTLTNWFDKLARCRRGKCDKLFVGLLAFGKDEKYNSHPLPVIQDPQNKLYVWDSKAKEYPKSEEKKRE